MTATCNRTSQFVIIVSAFELPVTLPMSRLETIPRAALSLIHDSDPDMSFVPYKRDQYRSRHLGPPLPFLLTWDIAPTSVHPTSAFIATTRCQAGRAMNFSRGTNLEL
jgi:hypothetical protein